MGIFPSAKKWQAGRSFPTGLVGIGSEAVLAALAGDKLPGVLGQISYRHGNLVQIGQRCIDIGLFFVHQGIDPS